MIIYPTDGSAGTGPARGASAVRVCPHLLTVADDDRLPDLVGLLTGQALAYDVACTNCDRGDEPVLLAEICQGCADRLLEHNAITAWRGRPGVLERPEPVDATVLRWPLPPWLGEVIDLAPVHDATTSTWLALTADSRIAELAPEPTGRRYWPPSRSPPRWTTSRGWGTYYAGGCTSRRAADSRRWSMTTADTGRSWTFSAGARRR